MLFFTDFHLDLLAVVERNQYEWLALKDVFTADNFRVNLVVIEAL